MKKLHSTKWALKLTAILLTITLLISAVPSYVFASDSKDHTADSNISRDMTISYQMKGQNNYIPLNAPYTIDDITKIQGFRVNHSFALADIEDDAGQVTHSVKEGDYYLIDLPEKVIITNPSKGSVVGNNNKPIANYSFIEESATNWKIKIQFTDYIDTPNVFEIYGSMAFDFALDSNAIGDGETEQIFIPIDNNNGISLNITKPVPPPTTPKSLTKTVAKEYSDLTRELVWDIKIMPETGIFSGCIFSDKIDLNNYELKSIKHGDVALVENIDYTYQATSGEITYTIPAGRDGKNFQNIEITTIVKAEVYKKLLPTTISNTASLSGGENSVDINSNTATQTIKPDWFKKSGSPIDGNKIEWTLTANTTKQNMYNAIITDRLQADLHLDKTSLKVENNSVTVYDGTHTPESDLEVYAVYTVNIDGTADLVIYLPRGKSNASNAVKTITFLTAVKAPADITSSTPTYNNTASMTANFVGDGGKEETVPEIKLDNVGVAIPHVSVVKDYNPLTADDKKNGTITWTIDATSNLSNYGKAVLTDTLPKDQDFIADEIYWGNEKININTNPKAEISANGRTLTITFKDPKSLVAQQHITVKSKINKDIYGDNINRNFSNEVECALFDIAGDNEITTDSSSSNILIKNTVIAKSTSVYNGNTSGHGVNPRVDFTIKINENQMPLSNVIIKDNLDKIITEFQKSEDSSHQTIGNVKWTYVSDTLKIQRTAGVDDNLNIESIISAAEASYQGNLLSIDFGNGRSLNSTYSITFTAELDVSQNDIFKGNGSIRCRGNISTIEGNNLKTGTISSPATDTTPVIKNDVLGKSGVHLVKEQQALWTINLNQRQVTLRNTDVVDVLPVGLTLDPTSVKLYTKVIGLDGNFLPSDNIATHGTLVDNFSYTYLPSTMPGYEGRYVLTVTLPDDSSDYTMQFATDIDKRLLGKPISNSAYYAGTQAFPGNTDTNTFTFANTAGGGSISKSSITVYKMSKDNGKNLEATFTLNWLRNGNAEDPVFVRSLTSTDGAVTFYGLTRGEQYTIAETVAPNGYLLDDPTPVAFTAPKDGIMDAPPLTFYNTPIKTGSWTPSATKKLDGKNILHSFHFTLNDGDNVVMNGITKTALTNGDYAVEFSLADGIKEEDILNFTDDYIFNSSQLEGTSHLVSTRSFTLKETPSNMPGYGFDKKEQTLIVKAYNVKGRDALKIVIEDKDGKILSNDDGKFNQSETPVFTNTYRANGNIQLSAEKTIVGHTLDANQFTFELYEENVLIGIAKNDVGSLSSSNTFTGNVFFKEIKYTQKDVGTKVYRIVEKNTFLPGYTYDVAEYTVTVLVTDNDDGTLTSIIQNTTKKSNNVTSTVDNVSFTNTYTTTDTETQFTASKKLNGRILADEQFSFKLKEISSNEVFIRDIAYVTNKASAITFPKISYQQSDIGKSYYYQISEVNNEKSGYTYDDCVYTIKVDVMDNNDGTIYTIQTILKNGTAEDSMEFINNYKASGSTTISGQKELAGKKLPDEKFAFDLQQFDKLSGNLIGEKLATKNSTDGSFTFPTLSYTQNDSGKTYYYNVTEVNDGVGGYTYDDIVYTIDVEIIDNGDGTLDAIQTVSKDGVVSEVEKILFSNTYTTTDVSTAFTAQKTLDGRILEKWQFNFVLSQITENGTPINEIQKVANEQDGTVSFNKITYAQAEMGNTYYYQINETNDGKSGYGYDSSVYIIKVDIVDNDDGTLKTVETITRDGTPVLGAVFTNSYTTTNLTVALSAQKQLHGHELSDGQFQFLLTKKATDTAAETQVEKVTNKLDGSIVFTPLVFTQGDIGKNYVYTVSEVNDKKSGYTYDKSIYLISVKINDNGDGTLSSHIEIIKQESGTESPVSKIDFSNVYQSKKVSVPNTGSTAIIVPYIIIGAMSCASIIFLRKKRRSL